MAKPRTPATGHPADASTCTVTVSHPRASHLCPTPLDLVTADATATWYTAEGQLTVSLPRPGTAVLLGLDVAPPAEGCEA
ncbi:hypothetical protein [Streptomyces sp. NPDC020951]|uniref:hypothetical protein n=1 Tax=Streptomyces sp. NPDC020951 TaxID=3365104 RepID=UPI00378CF031